MSDLDRAIATGRLLLAAAEAAGNALHTARQALENGTAQLKEALADAESRREKLAHERSEADTALDRKFGE